MVWQIAKRFGVGGAINQSVIMYIPIHIHIPMQLYCSWAGSSAATAGAPKSRVGIATARPRQGLREAGNFWPTAQRFWRWDVWYHCGRLLAVTVLEDGLGILAPAVQAGWFTGPTISAKALHMLWSRSSTGQATRLLNSSRILQPWFCTERLG